MMHRRAVAPHSLLLLFGASALALGACSTTPDTPTEAADDTAVMDEVDVPTGELGFATELGEPGAFAAFEPVPVANGRTIDYSVIDDALGAIVLDTGPSLRRFARAPVREAGSRIQRGHDSPLRLEGNKIFFSRFDRSTTESMREYTDSLIAIGNQVDIAKLPKNEQLAYWYNLHNMIVIATIAEEYPVARPRDMTFGEDKVKFHDAKLVTIRGVPLSLRDIRRNIVYRYWDDPRVMYGFFHGDLASPNIRTYAWKGSTVSRDLDSNAAEFVNALRGVSRGRNVTYVSPLYYEAQAGLFPNWPTDLKAHLSKFASEDAQELIDSGKPIAPWRYEDRTADLVGGEPYSKMTPGMGIDSMPQAFRDYVREVGQKFETLQEQGRLRSATVTIIDVPGTEWDVEGDASGEVD
ncbi:DUF547 domain-containing protein [Parvularcula sp. LCG005]|uniref:DUF547 domain-containing protein n=1 Tax=Parvularcula sp. LCG005 TaxID=3078805 RepID=UPI0029434A85|nr:DUF547 domain-containing protein [Parvularcula sp. LCG005]WOI52460.1 DUF547 domain-containing protein [Parvularcula sp. LCG005]